jgi:hypothetical protein
MEPQQSSSQRTVSVIQLSSFCETYWEERWVGPTRVMDTVVKINILYTLPGNESWLSITYADYDDSAVRPPLLSGIEPPAPNGCVPDVFWMQ